MHGLTILYFDFLPIASALQRKLPCKLHSPKASGKQDLFTPFHNWLVLMETIWTGCTNKLSSRPLNQLLFIPTLFILDTISFLEFQTIYHLMHAYYSLHNNVF